MEPVRLEDPELALERQLVAEAQAGGREAFDRLIRRHLPGVHGTLFRLVGNHEDAEDLAQETFVRAWNSLAHFRGDAPLRPWLSRIALHLAHDLFRRRGRGAAVIALEGLEREPASKSEAPTEQLSQREVRARLAQAVERLPESLRAALVMRVLEGREYDEVAAATGLRPGTVRTQVMKARRLLLRMLGPILEQPETER